MAGRRRRSGRRAASPGAVRGLRPLTSRHHLALQQRPPHAAGPALPAAPCPTPSANASRCSGCRSSRSMKRYVVPARLPPPPRRRDGILTADRRLGIRERRVAREWQRRPQARRAQRGQPGSCSRAAAAASRGSPPSCGQCALSRSAPCTSAATDRHGLERDLRVRRRVSASSRTHAASRCRGLSRE